MKTASVQNLARLRVLPSEIRIPLLSLISRFRQVAQPIDVSFLRPSGAPRTANLEEVIPRLAAWELSADLRSLTPKRHTIVVRLNDGSIWDWQSYIHRWL